MQRGRNSAIAAMVAALLGGCDSAPAEPEVSGGEARVAVRVAEVRAAPHEERHRFPGVVRARDRATPSFLHAGALAERRVARGQRVEKGQPLAILHNPALVPTQAAAEGQVRELDARIAQLRRDFDRARSLRGRDLIAENEVDRLGAELEATVQAREQAVARRSEAREQVKEMTLRAPFDAEVTDLFVEPGDFVAAGQPVLELSGLNGLEVEIRVPTVLERRLETGMPVIVSPVLQEGRFQGRIASLGRSGSGLAPLIVHLEADPRLSPGESVRVHLVVPASESLQVPLAAVLDPGGQEPHVLVLADGDIVRRVPVTPGRLTNERVAVEAPLAPGDRVVTAGQGRLEAGDQVRVLP